jgi:hypothetical protein
VPFFVVLLGFGADAISRWHRTTIRNLLLRHEIASVAPNGTLPASGDVQRGAVIFRTGFKES